MNVTESQAACARLEGELILQEQLEQAGRLEGAAMDRAQLFSWLRKSAADKRRTQELRLELVKQQELNERYAGQLHAQQAVCIRLQHKCEGYEELVRAEQRKRKLKSMNMEESEIEERASWQK